MEWKTSYILVRRAAETSDTGTASPVALHVIHTAEKLKDARYWLQYIALPKDAIFTTPCHPKYTGAGQPAYMAHLVTRGKIEHSESIWNQAMFGTPTAPQLTFSEPPAQPKAGTAGSANGAGSEMQIMQLADGKPHTMTIEQLAAVLVQNTKKLEIVLADATKWIDWESALTLMTRDLFVIGVDKNSKFPLTVTLKPKEGRGETMNYEPEMRFIVRPRSF